MVRVLTWSKEDHLQYQPWVWPLTLPRTIGLTAPHYLYPPIFPSLQPASKTPRDSSNPTSHHTPPLATHSQRSSLSALSAHHPAPGINPHGSQALRTISRYRLRGLRAWLLPRPGSSDSPRRRGRPRSPWLTYPKVLTGCIVIKQTEKVPRTRNLTTNPAPNPRRTFGRKWAKKRPRRAEVEVRGSWSWFGVAAGGPLGGAV